MPRAFVLVLDSVDAPRGRFGCAAEVSHGKDTPSGHWEMAGCPVRFDWGYFPNTSPCFPPELVEALSREARLPGMLGDTHASGTDIIVAFGEGQTHLLHVGRQRLPDRRA